MVGRCGAGRRRLVAWRGEEAWGRAGAGRRRGRGAGQRRREVAGVGVGFHGSAMPFHAAPAGCSELVLQLHSDGRARSSSSAGDVAKDDSKKEGGEGGEQRPRKPKDPNAVKRLTGSQRRNLKKQNPKKEDSNDGEDGDDSKSTTVVPEVIVEEKQEMTLEEYEKKLGKKKASEPSKPEERMVAPEEFEGLKLLEKKKMEDDDRLKLENGQRKASEAAAKEGKARKRYMKYRITSIGEKLYAEKDCP